MRYTAISTGIWDDKEFCELNSQEKLAYIFFLTSPFANMAGFYKLPSRIAELYLGENAKAILQKPTKLWKYDFSTEQMLLPNYLKYNTVKSPNQMKGLAGSIRGLEYTPMFIDFFLGVYKYSDVSFLQYVPDDTIKYLRKEAELNPDARSEIIKSMLNRYLL